MLVLRLEIRSDHDLLIPERKVKCCSSKQLLPNIHVIIKYHTGLQIWQIIAIADTKLNYISIDIMNIAIDLKNPVSVGL